MAFQALHQFGAAALSLGVIGWALVRGRSLRFSSLWNIAVTLVVAGVLALAAMSEPLAPFGAMLIAAANTGIFIKWLRPLFPPLVTGTVVFTIGLSLYPTAINYMAGGKGAPGYGSLQNWIVAAVTLAVVTGLNHFAKGWRQGRNRKKTG